MSQQKIGDGTTSSKDIVNERFLTVGLYPEPAPKIPWIRLRGLWLSQAGFKPGTIVRIRIMPGCLVITPE